MKSPINGYHETRITGYRKPTIWNWLFIKLGFLDVEWEDYIEVQYTATPFIPGNTFGPPESCYPDEGGEVEIQEVYSLLTGKEVQLTLEQEQRICDEIANNIALNRFSDPEPFDIDCHEND